MKTRFIDFEGIHGSGKSACAWNLYNNLNKNGIGAKVYFEYDLDNVQENPCDFNHMAVIRKTELDLINEKFIENKERIMGSIKQYGEYYGIFYGNFKDIPKLLNELQKYNAYEGMLEACDFIKLVKTRIQHFVDEALKTNYIYVFESVIFQQILNELIRFSDCTVHEMIACIIEIEKILKPLNPMFFYLKPDDLRTQIDKVAAERLSDNYDLYPDWIDWMVEYVKNSRYGNRNHVENQEDLMKYFCNRQEIEDMAFNLLTISKQEFIVGHVDYQAQNEYLYNAVVK